MYVLNVVMNYVSYGSPKSFREILQKQKERILPLGLLGYLKNP